MYEATSTSAREYAQQGKLEAWIHLFLQGEGNNAAFSEGLKLCERFFKGPERMSLDLFQRNCGPEPTMKWRISEAQAESFWRKIDEIAERYAKGDWDMPPLIVMERNGKILELNDGNHRYEALRRLGVTEYWVIRWGTV